MARVLVVDDQQSILLMIEALLHKQGHVVTSVTNPVDGLDKLLNFPFDLLITDIVMPGGSSGFDLIKSVKANEKLAKMPIVMLSGKREKKDVEKGILAGADDYVVKPIDPDTFLARIGSLLKEKAPHTIDFVDCSVRESFQWEVSNEIVRVSEIGLVLNSTLAVETGSKLKINSFFLDQMGLRNVTLRVFACEKALGESNHYIIKTHFIGLTEASLQPLRLWVRNQAKKSVA